MKQKHKVLIVGGGFAGISTALELCKKKRQDIEITLISNRAHFEYHATLYRLVTGYSADEVVIPLKTIFKNKPVTIIKDKIKNIDQKKNTVKGAKKTYSYDYLILAIGSEPAYYSIPGLKTHAFTLYSVKDALKLNAHVQEMIKQAADDEDEAVEDAHFVIIGGGATGVELAGELAIYTRRLCKKYNLDYSYITIDLIEAQNRVLSHFPKAFSEKVQNRLRDLDVNLFLNQKVVKNKNAELELKNMDIRSKTIIWTAGMKAHSLYKKIGCFDCDERGRVCVNEELRANGCSNIFIAGDAAKTLYSGLAPIALWHGEYIAKAIARKIDNKPQKMYTEKPANSAIPVGRGWAAVAIDNAYYYGAFGWFLRRFVDFRFFNHILPFSEARVAFKKGNVLEDTKNLTIDEL
jgi:NADH dehydrogenase